MLEINQIHHGDCIEEMKKMDDNTIDLVVIDPPYNIKKDSWDDIENYENWMKEVILELQRVLKDNGTFYMFHSEMEVVADFMQWFRKDTNFRFRQFIVWNKRFESSPRKGFLDGYVCVENLRNYQQMAEYILCYTFQGDYEDKKLNLFAVNEIKKYVKNLIYENGGNVTNANKFYCDWSGKTGNYRGLFFGECQPILYTEQQYMGLSKYIRSLGFEGELKSYQELLELHEKGEYDKRRFVFNNQKTHHSVWNYDIEKKIGHVTPKPLDLIKSIIKHSSNKESVVLDCFMGSGTTAVACKELGRNFIGIEKEQKYVDIANKRLEQNTLFANTVGGEDES